VDQSHNPATGTELTQKPSGTRQGAWEGCRHTDIELHSANTLTPGSGEEARGSRGTLGISKYLVRLSVSICVVVLVELYL